MNITALGHFQLVGAEGPLFKYTCALGCWDVACSLNRSPQKGRAEHMLPCAPCWERSLREQKLASTHKGQIVEVFPLFH